MATGNQLQTTIVINGAVAASLAKALNQVQNQTTKASKKMDGLGAALSKGLQVVGVTMLANEVRQLGLAGIETASNLAEVQNVVDVTFAESASQINTWSKEALNAYGLSELQAKQYSGTMGAMLKSSGLVGDNMIEMSTRLTELAGDMASFYNLDHDMAWEKIRSGISGETEPLKQLGINMSVANLEAFALSRGIKTSYQNMDQASQTALRYAYLMDVTKDAQGDFARTQGGYANQTRLLSNNIQQLSATFMTNFLPAITDAVTKGNEFIGSIKPEQVQAFADTVINGASAAWELGSTISNNWDVISPIVYGIAAATAAWKIQMMLLNKESLLAMGIQKLTAAWDYATTVISLMRSGTSLAAIAQMELNLAMSANPVGLVIAGFGLLVAAGVALYKNWDTVTGALQEGWTWFNNLIQEIPDFALVLAGPLAPILLLIKHFKEVVEFGKKAVDAVSNFFGLGPDKDGKYTTTVQGNYGTGGMKMYASGGFANQPSIFGEAGPEMAIPIKPNNQRSIRLWQDTGRMIGATASKAMQLIYSPNITAANVQGVKEALEDDFEKFKAWAEQYFGDKSRVVF
jgi:hypothetical protein